MPGEDAKHQTPKEKGSVDSLNMPGEEGRGQPDSLGGESGPPSLPREEEMGRVMGREDSRDRVIGAVAKALRASGEEAGHTPGVGLDGGQAVAGADEAVDGHPQPLTLHHKP